MAVAIGIWLALLGYTVVWAGWRNVGITYSPQTDGSVTPSSPPVTLLDAFLCRSPQQQTTTPSSTSSSPGTGTETPPPQLAPLPVPTPQPGGIFAPIATPQPEPTPSPSPFPAPPPLPGPQGVPGLLSTIGLGVENVLQTLVAGLRL